jgi:hypothetical protein
MNSERKGVHDGVRNFCVDACSADSSVDDVGFIDKVTEDMPRRLGTVMKGQVSHAATVLLHRIQSLQGSQTTYHVVCSWVLWA